MSVYGYIKVYGIYNEAIFTVDEKMADQDIILTLLHQKHRHIQNVRIWCFERNAVWLKEGLILVWKEDCTSSERKHCMFRGILYIL